MNADKTNTEIMNTNDVNNYLDCYGIHSFSEETSIIPADLIKQGFKEFKESQLGRFDMLAQHMPELGMHFLNQQGTYRVIFNEGLGVLQKAKNGVDCFRGNVVNPETGKIAGQALLKATSSGPLVANAVFSAMSFVTGQYFLAEINEKLAKIEKELEEIKWLFETEKSCNLTSNYNYLEQVIKTFDYIDKSEAYKQATIQQLQSIRRDSDSNYAFYMLNFTHKKNELLQIKKDNEKERQKISRIIEELIQILLKTKCALLTYSLSYFLETILSGIWESDFIGLVKKDIFSKIEEYNTEFSSVHDELYGFLNKAKAYSENKVLETVIGVAGAEMSILLFNPFLGAIVLGAYHSADKKKKQNAKNEVISAVNNMIQKCEDDTEIRGIIKKLYDFDHVINKSKFELVFSNNTAYYRLSDIN